MLKCERQNFHRSKLPRLGSIVRAFERRFIVVAYPLCDNDWPYSIGIHRVYLRCLHNGQTYLMAGHLCEEGET